jgi:D-alanine-D-alanine ligase
MNNKIRVGIIFGGQSSEHEVSIQSAKNVFEALDKTKYDVSLIGISKKGNWLTIGGKDFQQIAAQSYAALPEKISSAVSSPQLAVVSEKLDVVFPILHGILGEDGTVQGLLKLMGIPFVGADVLGSAVGMDKDIMKRLLRDAGIPIVRFLVFQKKDQKNISFAKLKKELGLPFFIKPANAGSSIGVSKVSKGSEFRQAINEAFKHDRKILIEEGIPAREIECSVLGNEEKTASIPGEIVPTHEFYDYDAKYLDENGAVLEIPAKLSKEQIKQVQDLAIKTCEVLCVDGMSRVDFFLDKKTAKLYLNEVNTIPGFTPISMYPKLWEASGLSYPDLIDRLLQLALERANK